MLPPPPATPSSSAAPYEWTAWASSIVGYLFAVITSIGLILVTLVAVNAAVDPHIDYSADSTSNDVIGLLLYLMPLVLGLVAGFFIARAALGYLRPALQALSKGAVVALTAISIPLAIVFTLAIIGIGFFALMAALTIPEQVEAEVPGYTVIFRQETDMEYTTLRLELHRADGWVAGERIESNDVTVCQKLAIKTEGTRVHLLCDRASQSELPALTTDIDLERKIIFIDSRDHWSRQISFDQLNFYQP
jgi:hypothetical protein